MAGPGLGLLGRKVGMTRVFAPDGRAVAVTVVQAGPCPVVRVKSDDGKDGYDAIQVAFEPIRPKLASRPVTGQFEAAQLPPHRVLREFRLNGAAPYATGDVLKADLFVVGERVDVTARRKGRGFQGVMKRHNFHGLPGSHGTKLKDRHPGSIGASAWPSRVFAGTRMPGRMGATRVTVQRLEVVGVDAERNLVLIKGAVPGPDGGLVTVRKRTSS